MSSLSSTLIFPTTTPKPIPPVISSSPSSPNDTSKCTKNCFLAIALTLTSLIVCLVLLKLLYKYLRKRRNTNSVVDIENPDVNHTLNHHDDDRLNGNPMTTVPSDTVSNHPTS